jgi:uncharacterized protein YkwD
MKKQLLPFLLLLIVWGIVAAVVISHNQPRQQTKPQQAVQQPTKQKTKYEVGPPDAQELLELVNAERTRVGVAPLVVDERLNQSAQMKAEDMLMYNYFGHTNHDGTQGYTLAFKTLGDACTYVSENIVQGAGDYNGSSQWMYDLWKRSPPHYGAMIDPRYIYTGFGIAGTYDGYKVVEHFCIPR